MRLGLVVEPQHGLTYVQLLAIARRAEQAGFDAFYRSDHYDTTLAAGTTWATDAWSTIAGLARDTDRIQLGTLVTPVTFRSPGVLAKTVATVDEMSSGRAHLGMGTGWSQHEHERHGVPFPDSTQRAQMLSESLDVIKGLWLEPDGWSYHGRYWSVIDSRMRPKYQSSRHPRLIVGGHGRSGGVALAARVADEYNFVGATPEQARAARSHLSIMEEANASVPRPVDLSVMLPVIVAADRPELTDRFAAVCDLFGVPPDRRPQWLSERAKTWIAGTPAAVVDRLREYAAVGVERFLCQDLLPLDGDLIELIGEHTAVL